MAAQTLHIAGNAQLKKTVIFAENREIKCDWIKLARPHTWKEARTQKSNVIGGNT